MIDLYSSQHQLSPKVQCFSKLALMFIFSFWSGESLAQTQVCEMRLKVPSLGGAANAVVDLKEAQRWKAFKNQRVQERLQEALSPQLIYASYRIENAEIEKGCVDLAEMIDIGRGLFLRQFTRAEGYGHAIPNRRAKSRIQSGHFGGPDAGACVDCHWKGGFAGSGDRVDNTYAFGDGQNLDLADARNPPALWGAGWVQALAVEMSTDLQVQRDLGIEKAKKNNTSLVIQLESKGVYFGTLQISAQGEVDTTKIEGIDVDLQIKPFGWKGVFGSLREFVEISAHKHLGMQSEYLTMGSYHEVDLGSNLDRMDPDQDGKLRELTEAQILSLVSFLATLDTPKIEMPTHGKRSPPSKLEEVEFIDTPAFIERWQKGSHLFEQIGCSECHRPFLRLDNPKVKTPWYRFIGGKVGGKKFFEIDLSQEAALPHPEMKRILSKETGENNMDHQSSRSTIRSKTKKVWLVPVFSDFKRHKMGAYLRSKHIERGVEKDEFLTRRLWGLRKTSPYLHHGGAMTFEEAIAAHGGEGSEAKEAAELYVSLNSGEKNSLILFLSSLSRGPAIRIR